MDRWSRASLGPSSITVTYICDFRCDFVFALVALVFGNRVVLKLTADGSAPALLPVLALLQATNSGRYRLAPDHYGVNIAVDALNSARRGALAFVPPGKRHIFMDKDRIKGAANQAKGVVKEVAGKVTGDAKLESEGKADKVAGKVQNAIGGLKDTIRGK
jgi:uncharacterized protein YjbJ (UPF0337 family)